MSNLIPIEIIEKHIYLIRGRRVMLDADLAELYGVGTKVLNQAIKRNQERFPDDFMFQLNEKEMKILRSQFVTSSWGGRRYLPLAFTEQGVAMLSTVLKSKRAIQMNILIMRTFVKLREMMGLHRELSEKIDELEAKYTKHDDEIQAIFLAIKKLLIPPDIKKKKPLGF